MADLLKNLFSESFVKSVGDEFKKNSGHFNHKKFISAVLNSDWESRELKDRMHHITKSLHSSLELNYSDQLKVLDKVAPKFTGFTATIFPNFVEHFGIHDESKSLDALHFYTRFSTSEFAIRPFLKKNPQLISVLFDWTADKNYHVRRLASEGCRPLLPWAMKLEQYVKNPEPIIPILEKLKNDPEDYVYRSVANNLNDISKNHPQRVIQLAEKWKGKSDTTDWVVKHALRTLLKKGNPNALKIIGISPQQKLEIHKFSISNKSVSIGDSTQFTLEVLNPKTTAKFRIEYVISYLKKNGTHSDKVFQLTEKEFKKNVPERFIKKIDFKDLSTRKHYTGEHFISIKINGQILTREKVVLKQK